MKSPENSSSHQEMHEHEEHLPSNNLPAETETDAHDSSAGCSKENLDFFTNTSAAGKSYVAGVSSENSDTCKLVVENTKHLHVESASELSGRTPVIEESSFNLLLLYQEVTNRGGFEQVTKDGRWSEVASALNLKIEAPYLAFMLQQIYVYLLEQMYILTMQQEKAGQLQVKEDSICLASRSQDVAVEEEHMQGFMAPNADVSLIGRIEAKFNNNYLITVRVGSEELKGFLFDIEECNCDLLSVMSQMGITTQSNLHLEFCSDSKCQTLAKVAKPKSKSGRKKMATKKDPHAPRRARSAFQIFLQGYLKKVQRKSPKELAKDVWKGLSRDEQLPYIEASQKEESCRLEGGPDSPKKARSAYEIFCSEHIGPFRKINQSNIMKTAASTWKSLSENERLPYIEENQKDKERYKREMAAYKDKQDAENRMMKNQSCQSKVGSVDCYHVSLQTEQETEEVLVKDESAIHIAEHLMKNGDLLDVSQMDWDLSESLHTRT